MNHINEVFINNLKAIRKKKNISQAKLAEIADLSSGIIGEIETGHSNPNLSTIDKIAKALDVPVYQLLYDIEEDYNYTPMQTNIAKKELLLKLIDELTEKI